MKNFKVFLISIAGLLITNPVIAASSDMITCPASINCNSDTGLCEIADTWTLYTFNARETFEGTKTLDLSDIDAVKMSGETNYVLICNYDYSEGSTISISAEATKLNGPNWVYGFGKQMASCSNVKDPSLCTGENS